MAVFSQLCERVNYEGCWKYWLRGPQVGGDKTALVSSPITTGIRLMSLLTAIPAAKLWCQQMADISQITFVVSEEVGSNTEQAPSHKIFSIQKTLILQSSNHDGNAVKGIIENERHEDWYKSVRIGRMWVRRCSSQTKPTLRKDNRSGEEKLTPEGWENICKWRLP